MSEHTLEVLNDYTDADGDEMQNSYDVTFDFYAYSIPARLHGNPDNWCPGDFDSNWDITKVVLNGKEIEWKDLDRDVQHHLKNKVDEWVTENGEEACEDDVDYEPDYDDYDDLPNDFVPAGYDPYGGP